MSKRTPRRTLLSARAAAGLTRREVSVRLNCTVQALSDWERHRRVPNGKFLVMLAQLYGMREADIVESIESTREMAQ
jgi:transcriptional regulator with XRE-family HTH domain